MRRGRTALVGALVVGVVLAATGTAVAAPPPADPGDGALNRSQDQVSARAAEVGQLTGRLAELDSRTDDLQADLAARREDAEAALDDLTAAQAAAAEAARRAEEARVATDAASAAVDDARGRMDVFVSATYQEGLDTRPFGLLIGAQDPADLVARAEYSEIVARSELAARDGLERARVARTNAESTAKAARADAEARQSAATAAKQASDAALTAADAAAQEQVRALADLDAQRAAVQAQLDAAEAHDAVLHAQRDRFRAWQRQMAAGQAAREEAARRDAADRLALLDRPAAPGIHLPAFPRPARGGSVQRVIDRALSQVGVQYVWGRGQRPRAHDRYPGQAGIPAEPDRLRLLRADALRLQRCRRGTAPSQPQPVQRGPEGPGVRPAGRVTWSSTSGPGRRSTTSRCTSGAATWWRRPIPARTCASCRCAARASCPRRQRVEDLDPRPVERRVLGVVAGLVDPPLADLLGVEAGRGVEDGDAVAHQLAVGDHRQLDGLEALEVDDALLVDGHEVGDGEHRDLVDRLEAGEAGPIGGVADVVVRRDRPDGLAPVGARQGDRAASPGRARRRRRCRPPRSAMSFDCSLTIVTTFCLPLLGRQVVERLDRPAAAALTVELEGVLGRLGRRPRRRR